MLKNSHGYVNSDYLAAAGKLFTGIKRRSYELLGDIDAARVLDIGCGAGLDTLALGTRVGAAGKVVGVDHDAEMIAQAGRHAEQGGVAAWVEHCRADALDLPFAAGQFDAARCERLFMHLADPAAALAEALRVLRPGGTLVLVDTDWGSLSAATGADRIERRLAHFRSEKIFPNGYSGRRLYGLMAAAELADITVEPVALHLTDLALWRFLTQLDNVEQLALEQQVLTGDELRHWHAALQDVSQRQAFYGSVTVVTAAACKPAAGHSPRC